jgi:hypothetical protein
MDAASSHPNTAVSRQRASPHVCLMQTAGHIRLDKAIGSASKPRRMIIQNDGQEAAKLAESTTSARAVEQDLFDAFLSWKTSARARSFDQDLFDAVLSSIYSPEALETLEDSPVSESRDGIRFVKAALRRVADARFNRMRPFFCALN